ncbi:MAG: hypothetical protein GKC10_02835 [Methanosarcinales archaeon]|nr:hypothetical protein [Methanosarcinales archaeon]
MVGALAALLTMFGFVPQILKIMRTRSVEDMSLPMMYQFSLGVFLWLLYGIYLHNRILIVANLVSLACFVAGIALYFRYRSQKAGQQEPAGGAS